MSFLVYNKLMDNTVINAIISGVVTLLVAYFGYLKIRKENDLKDAIREQKQMDRLDRIEDKIVTLSKKVDIHNGYAEKFSQISEDIALIKKDIEYLKKG